MDEPFGALDPLTRDALGTATARLHDRLGMTTVMVTHDMQEAVLLADRIAVMRAGRLVADGTPRPLLAGSDEPDVAGADGRRRGARPSALASAGGTRPGHGAA